MYTYVSGACLGWHLPVACARLQSVWATFLRGTHRVCSVCPSTVVLRKAGGLCVQRVGEESEEWEEKDNGAGDRHGDTPALSCCSQFRR